MSLFCYFLIKNLVTPRFLRTFALELRPWPMKEVFRHILFIMLFAVAALSANATEERTFTVINAASGLADNSAQAVVCTRTGRMIISTLGNLNFYNGTTFKHIVTRHEYQYPLPLYRGGYHLCFDRYHHLWLKSINSITCTDLTNELFAQNVDSVLRVMGCPMPVQDLFVDSIGRLWTMADQGLYGLEQKKFYNVLKDRNLQGMDVFGDLLLTFYDNGEEVGQDLTTGNTVHRTKAYDWETAQHYTNTSSILRYKDGYFQLRNGDSEAVLLYFDVRQLQWTTLIETPFHMNNIALEGNKLYIASEHGYCIYDIATQEQQWVKKLKLVSGEEIETDCNTLVFDRQGGYWVGTESRGLLYAKPKDTPFKVIDTNTAEAKTYIEMMLDKEQNITEFQGIAANCMYSDSRDWSWIGTTTGLFMYKDPHKEPIVFTRKTGFYNDVIHSVVEDANHNVWVATSDGISFIRFDGEEVAFVNSFNRIDNVPSESFLNCKAMMLPDSQIVMQGIDHVVVFRPEDLEEVNTPHNYKLFPKLTKIMVNGHNVEPNMELDGNVIINKAVARAQIINLNSDQNTITFSFSALNYYRPLQTYYRVRIKGRGDEGWNTYSYYNSDFVDKYGMLHLPLFGLEPGDYTVDVQASMFPGIWDGEPFSWEIHVNQSWLQAKGMYYFLGLIVLVLIIVNFIVYTRNTRMRVRRNHEEGDIINKIRMFVERAESLANEKLSPMLDEHGAVSDHQMLDQEFIDIMQKIIPYVRESRKEDLSMHKLGDVADVDIVHLYEVITSNIYKSSRDMTRQVRLKKAATLLATTDKTVEAISDECGFYTPNYFMGNFFHEYKQTPAEYREENKKE